MSEAIAPSPRILIRRRQSLQRRIEQHTQNIQSGTVSNRVRRNNLRHIEYLRGELEQLPQPRLRFITHHKSVVFAPKERLIAHCVASDLWMSRGAAADLSRKFPGIL